MKLISMIRFVLEQQEKFKSDRFYYQQFKDNVVSYATFLKQSLTLGMFVPCDENGNVLNPPIERKTLNGYEMRKSEVLEYEKAKEWVLFKDCEVKQVTDYYVVYFESQPIWISWTERTVEMLVGFNLELSDSAIKQIGL